jgi:hypothetical protein
MEFDTPTNPLIAEPAQSASGARTHHAPTHKNRTNERDSRPIVYAASGGTELQILVSHHSVRSDPILFWLVIK